MQVTGGAALRGAGTSRHTDRWGIISVGTPLRGDGEGGVMVMVKGIVGVGVMVKGIVGVMVMLIKKSPFQVFEIKKMLDPSSK